MNLEDLLSHFVVTVTSQRVSVGTDLALIVTEEFDSLPELLRVFGLSLWK